MCKLDKICKRDHKCITDRDIVLRNQFAENVRPTWLKRELKKRIRGTHTISFNDIREEATLLMEDGDVQETSQQQDNRTDDFEVPIFATQAKPSGTSDIAKVLEDLKSELQSIKSEVKTLKEEKQGAYRKPRDCYYCGKTGHIKRNCRSFIRDQGSRSVGAGTNGSSLVKKSVGSSPIVDMKIGDVVVSCILDTGSMVSTISESFFNKMLKSNFELHQDKSWLRLRAANGLDIPYVGYIETDVYLPLFGETIKDRGILILKDSPGVNRKDSSGLIGMNIISQCMDLFKTINNSIKPEHSEIKGFARVAGSSEICVPANSVSIVTVVGPTQTRSKDKIINIEPLSRNTEVMVIDSVSTTERNRYPVRIANLKSSDLWLKPNTRIGVIREVTCLVNQEESEVEFF
ncbi:Hypothetical predicted protein [Mytilus galloprovincialis]|uniref:CCHC-type domain-containing protein n=1 Tax=Mytilus galloprovincialis TaxID=29158 RepID=A0A8B6FEP8_MYTGA|nr:Hypothetical predicted protein [Mytilus galloprovincialis]